MTVTDTTVRAQTDAISFEFDLHHPPEKVWRALTDPEMLTQWLLPIVDLKLEPGAAFTFKTEPFPDWDGTVSCRFVEIEPVSLSSAIGLGAYQTYFWVKMTLLSVVKIFQGSVSARDLGGPILIVQAAGQQAELGLEYLIRFLGLISVNLGVLNLLPIPVLDGGHLLFFGFEAVRGKPLAIQHREMAQQVGLFLLLALMVFVVYNDISRIVAG